MLPRLLPAFTDVTLRTVDRTIGRLQCKHEYSDTLKPKEVEELLQLWALRKTMLDSVTEYEAARQQATCHRGDCND